MKSLLQTVIEIGNSPSLLEASRIQEIYNRAVPPSVQRAYMALARLYSGHEPRQQKLLPPQPVKKTRGRNTTNATKACQEMAKKLREAARDVWMIAATENAAAESKKRAEKGGSPKLPKTKLLKIAKEAGAPKNMTVDYRHFKWWRANMLSPECVDRRNRNAKPKK